MGTNITDTEMTSDRTRHTARAWPVPGEPTLWSVTWLPGRALTRDQAISAMTIAESVDAALDPGSTERVWPHVTGWAGELGLCDIDAVAMASLPPEYYLPAATSQDDEGEPEQDSEDGQDTSADSALIGVMTADERAGLLTFIAGYAPGVFVAALGARSEEFADELAERVDAREEAEYLAEPEGYCTVCGANVGWFIGYEGPQHFRGPHKLLTGAERRELFDAGHEPAVAWRESTAVRGDGK